MQQNPIFTSPYMANMGSTPSMDMYRQSQIMENYSNQPYRPQSAIPGRMVENMDTVRGIEIPMDGGIYYFPKADGNEIYTKRWLPNGSTQVLRYVVKTDEEQQAEDNFLVDKLNSIEDQLQKLVSQRQNNHYNKPNKNSKGDYERRDSK